MGKHKRPQCQHEFITTKPARAVATPDPARPGWYLWPEVLCADGTMRSFGATFPPGKGTKLPAHKKPYGVDWLPEYMLYAPAYRETINRAKAGKEALLHEQPN